jgi:mannose-1-phosphate guanylyltransferase
MRFGGLWKDLGTWNSLTEVMEDQCIGKAIMNDECRNVHIVNEIDVPILAMGLENVVISASPEGILVSDKEQASLIKPFVDGIDQQIMFAEKSWGSFRVLDVTDESMTIKVTLNPGSRMNYHSHSHRNETWVVTSGTGYAIVDDISRDIRPGEVITMPAGLRHTVVAKTKLQLIEVQLGKDITVHDKEKFDFPDVRQ